MFESAPLKTAEIPLALLKNAGFEAYIVGGAVRDTLLFREVHDVDIATSALPSQTMEVFSEYRVIETGIKHGTVMVIINSEHFEVTTFRIDGNYSDNRRPDSVSFTDDLRADLARRDFTINALAYSPSTGVVDYFGGREDMQERKIRAVGDAKARFGEDALRILRALRFASELEFEIEEETASAAFDCRGLLKNIASERVSVELFRLLCGDGAMGIITKYVDILGAVIPELLPMKDFPQKTPYHIYDVLTHTAAVVENTPKIPYMRLAALLHDAGKPATFTSDKRGRAHFYGHGNVSLTLAEAVMNRLKLDNFTKSRVKTLIKYHDTNIPAEKKAIKRWLNRLSPEIFFELMEIKQADNMAQNLAYSDRRGEIEMLFSMAKEIIAEGDCFSLKELAMDGNDLIKLGIPKGKELGKILSRLLNLVIDGTLPNKYEALAEYVKNNRS